MDPCFDDSLYIYVTSDANLKFYPNNNPSSFINQIFPPLSIPEESAEVGIVELQYNDNFDSSDERPQKSQTFFNHTLNDKV
jgi:hypothetical protein